VFTEYGQGVILKFLAVIGILVACSITLVHNDLLKDIVLLIISVTIVFVLVFFRDPKRIPPDQRNIVVSPADGKIILIKELFEPEYLKQDAIQISIFMSPLDVHVNRFPISGIVKYFRYIQGEYVVAFAEKSSERNERTHIGVEDGGFKLLFKQIAGMVARRIIAHVNIDQQVTAGERFGMIRFGSRVDVIMPKGTEVRVRLQERVRSGETILATYRADPNLGGMN